MAKNIYVNTVTAPTAQTAPLPGREDVMAANNAGGYSFKLDDWSNLERFLVLGSENGTYYVKQDDLIMQNVRVLNACIAENPQLTAEMIAAISESGRAFKNNVAMFALAYMVKLGGAPRFAAYKVINRVLRTGRSFMEFHESLEKMGVTSTMSRRKAYQRWYLGRKPSDLAYQALKYPTSGNLSQRDLLRYGHVISTDPTMKNVISYLVEGAEAAEAEGMPEIVAGWEAVKAAKTAKEVAALVGQYRLTWEFVPGQWQGDKDVWQALLPNLPYMALLRNLARLSSYRMLDAGSANSKFVRERLTSADNLRKARIHPMSVLVAWRTYSSGGELGKTNFKWTPNSVVRDALEEAFYLAFDQVEPANKNFLFGLDVSGSMSSQCGSLPIKCSEASAVMAMVSLRAEKDSYVMGFDHGIRDLGLSKHDSLERVLGKISNINAGGTDCALPMMHALDNGMQLDCFVVLTDSETYYGRIHPSEALAKYRKLVTPDAKLVVVGMTSNGFTIGDPADPGTLDVVGLSPDVPALVSKFAAGL